MIETGQPAPAFTLPDQDDKKTSLASLKGKWVVLYFYPRDDTPGCTTEACEFTAAIAGFTGMNATVIGCSADSPESHQKFIAKYKLAVTLLSDPNHAAMEAYGAWGEKMLYGKKSVGVIRSTVIIDQKGRVAHRWAKVSAEGHADQVRKKLVELQSASAAS